ncbi:MAG: helix-turn-helix transcriptional regulator [Patescibacteria group bacterium]
MKKQKYISHKEFMAEMMKRPGFKKAYDDLELEFTLIRAILDQRMRKGITQKQLAEKVGTKQSAIARFESGNSNPTLAFVKKLSEALDLKLTVHR